MGKEDVVSAAKADLLAAQDQVITDILNSVYDKAAIDQKAADGTLSQADLDAAVAAAVSQAQAVDAQALADAQNIAKADLAALQAVLDQVSAKEQAEETAVGSLQGALKSAQDSIAAIFALFPQPPSV